ncbi:conserved hypothetical protein [Microsporum canis CBS 113480]|uniref:Uncharacterized protein n=1 Tax=Arthroderma otae (strain ATCC MYA-4605 / CBS 113480) TaxID=554155 RepID=C5FR37_ARTOC|nr:conserved hypothetical protein [Microsporum canis CBS 113480]EEQ32340.1 conserved hypothetical protein [Microsporum canis CBS 113480]
MDYLSSICRNFTSFLTLQNIPNASQKTNTTADGSRRPYFDHTMLSSLRPHKLRNDQKALKGGINENGNLTLLKSETSGAGRKRKIIGKLDKFDPNDDKGNNSVLDGSTIIGMDNPSKRLRVPARLDESESLERYYSSSYDSDLEGSTLIEDEQLGRAKDSHLSIDDLSTLDSDTSSGSVDKDSSVSLEDYDQLDSDREAEAGENDTEHQIIKTPSRQPRIKKASRHTCDTEEPYRPSPNVVDKNLSKQIVHRDTQESDLSEDEIYNYKSSTKKEVKRDLDIEFCMEKARRWAAAVEGPSGNWADAERDMYFRLAMRGFEPVLPHSWRMDFMTLPDSLFTAPNDYTAYISCRNEFRVNIMNLKLIAVAESYQSSWCLTPNIESDDGADDYFDAESELRYQDRTFPVITGFLICGTIVALMTLDSDPRMNPIFNSKTSGRLISRFDFSEYGQDVWNALAIAIAVARMRKTIIQCEQEGKGDIMWMIDQIPRLPDKDL